MDINPRESSKISLESNQLRKHISRDDNISEASKFYSFTLNLMWGKRTYILDPEISAAHPRKRSYSCNIESMHTSTDKKEKGWKTARMLEKRLLELYDFWKASTGSFKYLIEKLIENFNSEQGMSINWDEFSILRVMISNKNEQVSKKSILRLKIIIREIQFWIGCLNNVASVKDFLLATEHSKKRNLYTTSSKLYIEKMKNLCYGPDE